MKYIINEGFPIYFRSCTRVKFTLHLPEEQSMEILRFTFTILVLEETLPQIIDNLWKVQ